MDFHNFLPYILWFFSMIFIVVSLYTLLLKKPLIINSIWILIMISLLFFAQMFTSIIYMIESPSIGSIVPIIAFFIFMIMFIFLNKGYMVYGVNHCDFQEKFIEILKEKNYEFKETLSKLTIKHLDREASITIQSGYVGTHIKVKEKKDRLLLKSLISELRKKEIKMDYLFPILYLILGALFCTLSIYLILN